MDHWRSAAARLPGPRMFWLRPAGRRAPALGAVIAVVALATGSLSAAAAGESPTAGAGPAPGSDPARPVYVTNSNNVGEGESNVARFATQPDGRLAFRGTVPAVQGVRGMVITPDLRFAYVAATQSDQISIYRIEADGSLSEAGSAPTEGPFGIAIAPDGRTVYVANNIVAPGQGTVSAFAVDPVSGQLTPRGGPALTGEDAPKAPAVTPDGRFLYVSHGTPGDAQRSDVVGFEIEPDGSLGGVVERAEAGIGGAQTLVTPDGRFVYVVHQRSDEVVGFRIGADGGLTEVARVVGGVWLEPAAMSPDGRLLYVGSLGFRPETPNFPPDPSRPSAVFGYRIGADGSLTQVARVAIADPAGVELAPNGRHLYVSSYTRHEVTTFAVDPSGGLTALQTLDTGGDRPAFDSTTVLPNRGPVAAFAAQHQPPGRTVRFDATASADHDGRVRRHDWDFGDGTTLADGGPTPRHTYRAPGSYRVRLTVTDDEGCSTRLVFTGQSAHCLGSDAATATRTVNVGG